MKNIKGKILIIVGAVIIAGASAYVFRGQIRDYIFAWRKGPLPAETRNVSSTPVAATSTKFAGINLAVPFSSQAPYGDWSLPYEQACEETSALLVDRFYKNEPLTPEIARDEILKIVDWENKNFGFYEHTTASETAEMIKGYFGYKRVDVEYDISIADIEAQIVAGRPVIAPFDGRELNNPYFHQPGPIYHMLVIKGITKDGKFITDDVGTKRGENYVYDAGVLYNAIHDAPAGGGNLTNIELQKNIPTGRKAMIVVYPN